MPSPTSHKCLKCKKNNVYYSNTWHQIGGVKTKIGLCTGCYGALDTKRIFYCHECEDIYKPDTEWWQHYPDTLGMVICREHSADDEKPRRPCANCGDPLYPHKGSMSLRGHQFCSSCSMGAVECKAKYCRALIHPDMNGVVASPEGMNHYCSDCAKAKTIPDGAPDIYHPLAWDYKKACGCSVCSYLAGRSDLWPPPPMDMLDLLPTVECTACHKEVRYTVEEDGHPYCHICTNSELMKCEECKKKKPSTMYHAEWSGAEGSPHCDSCYEVKGYWFCDIQCDAWFPPNTDDCNCHGVHSWKYTPDEFILLRTPVQENLSPKKLMFLGVELEVEALKPGTSKAQGARLARSLVGDFTYIVHDGSLTGSSHTQGQGTGGEKGFEIVTHPFTFDWFKNNWDRFDDLLNTLSTEGYRSWESGRCGIHIHVSRAPMTNGHQVKFIDFIYGSANLAMCIGQRSHRDKYLKKYSPFDAEDRSRVIDKVTKFINPGVNGHYAAINTTKKHTLEARWFRGTLNPTSFRKNIEFIDAVWHFTRVTGHRSANESNFISWLNLRPQCHQYRTLLGYIQENYLTRQA